MIRTSNCQIQTTSQIISMIATINVGEGKTQEMHKGVKAKPQLRMKKKRSRTRRRARGGRRRGSGAQVREMRGEKSKRRESESAVGFGWEEAGGRRSSCLVLPLTSPQTPSRSSNGFMKPKPQLSAIDCNMRERVGSFGNRVGYRAWRMILAPLGMLNVQSHGAGRNWY